MRFPLLVFRIGVCAAVLTACGDSGPTSTDGEPAGTLTIVGVPASLTRGDKAVLTAVARSSAGNVIVPTPEIVWSAAPADLATFERTAANAARASFNTPGTVRIRARWGAIEQEASAVVDDYARLSFDVDSVSFSTWQAARSFSVVSSLARVQPQLKLVESPEVSTKPVIDHAAFLNRRIVATGNGRALIIAHGDQAYPDTLIVNVRFAGPMVTGWRGSAPRVGDGDTLWLTGTLLDQLPGDAIRLNGNIPQRYLTEPTRIALKVPTLSSCIGTANALVTLTDAAGPQSFSIPQKAVGGRELDLELYRPNRLDSTVTDCLRLSAGPAGQAARYALIYAHTELIESAQERGNPYVPIEFFDIGLGAAPVGSTTQVRPPSAAVRASDALVPADGIAGYALEDIWNRSTPFALGDTITVQPLMSGTGPELMRVQKIYGGQFVVLMPVAAETAFARLAPELDAAMKFTLETTVPALRSMFLDVVPHLAATGQLPILVRPLNLNGDNSGGFATIRLLEVDYARLITAPSWIRTIAHELAHVWHFEKRRTPGFEGSWEKWHVEGLATFFSHDMVRRHYGYGFEANMAPAAGNQPGGHYYHAALNSEGGDFIHGYEAVASYLRDLVWVLMQARRYTHEHAMKIVLNGVANGWYGCRGEDCSAVGLAEVMKLYLGPAWDPGESILDWTTAQVLDELSADPRFQIPSFAQQSYVKSPGNFGGAEPLASWAAGAPQNVSAKVLVGSTGVFDVRAAQIAEFRLFSGRNVRWTIIRVE